MMPIEIIQSSHSWDHKMSLAPDTLDLSMPLMAIDDYSNSAMPARHLDDLGHEVVRLFSQPCELNQMLNMSSRLRDCYYEKLESSPACMLPSFCHTLPSGHETGTFVALDLGGSTFRVALVRLSSRAAKDKAVTIKRMTVSKIDERVRKMPSREFFDWMAEKIHSMLKEDQDIAWSPENPVALGLAWSFPIEQTSNRGGKVQGMGKGFYCHDGSIGKDLGDLISSACNRRGFQVRVEAIINDSSAVLLSQSYMDPATSMGLIMGTGTNAAAFLPTSCMGREKFGVRDSSWFARADKVITNTELSMFGKDILPETRWDDTLNRNHILPDFQPLEYMTTGRYLGEILRLIILEAVDTCGLLGGILPNYLRETYSLDTALLAIIEEDQSTDLQNSASRLKTDLELERTPSAFEMFFLRAVVQAISYRASAYLAVAIHALWTVQKETEINLTTPLGTPKTSIACNGSVILKYPGFRTRCEAYLELMVSSRSAGGLFRTEKIVLRPTDEAAIVGAAVAVAMADGN